MRTMSESAEALRERRRLKILNQAEQRMQKLLGVDSPQAENVSAEAAPAESRPTGSSHSHGAGYSRAENGSVDRVTNDRRSFLPSSPPLKSESFGTTPGHNIPEVINRLPASDNDEVDSDATVLSDKDLTNYRLLRKAVLLFLGVLVRLLLISEVGQWATQTIFNPFMTIELIIFGYERLIGTEWQDQVSGGLGGMWLTVFQLTGVNKDIIQIYRRIIACLGCVLTDFAFYFFAFVAVHMMIGV